jgi:dTDP-4-amino-4,6-dideoxygalactose transaminase
MAEVIKSGLIAQGEKVAAFEHEMARMHGVRGGVTSSSGTAALHLALLALNVGEGDEVLLPSYACAALLHAVRAVRALGALYQGRPVGSIGEAAVFSFYATKLITTGEGGMLVSNDERVLATGRDLREYDEKKDDVQRFNYKMTDFQAALGLAQLEQLPRFLDRRHAIASWYQERLQDHQLQLPLALPDRMPVYYRYVVKGLLPADTYLAKLQALGVEARRPVFQPLHRYMGLEGFPGAEEAWNKAISLPLYPSLSDGEIERILEAAQEVFQ